jgi:hypothetical protein
MQDPGYELPRNSVPRTPVNKGIKKGRGCYPPTRLVRPPLGSCSFNPRLYAAPFPPSMTERRAISKISPSSRTLPSPLRLRSSSSRRSW